MNCIWRISLSTLNIKVCEKCIARISTLMLEIKLFVWLNSSDFYHVMKYAVLYKSLDGKKFNNFF